MEDAFKFNNAVKTFTNAGLFLIPIPPVRGKPSKGPRGKSWNRPKSDDIPSGYSNNPDDFHYQPNINLGLCHTPNHTLVFDIDDLVIATDILEALGLPFNAWLTANNRIEIKSPKANRAKLLYRLPNSFTEAKLRQLNYQSQMIIELRSGACQDVLFGQHPDGGEYQFFGDPTSIPTAPDVLLDMLKHWDDWKPCLKSVINPDIPVKIATNKPCKTDALPGSRNPIKEFNKSQTVSDVLLAHDYTACGTDRFIRPGSSSKAPGVVILRNCDDGIERAFSHGGDVLNDGFAHDAFDCERLLKYGGDYSKALNWNPEITKHNQQLFIQEQAKQKQEKQTQQTDKEEANINELADGTHLSEDDIEALQNLNETCTHIVLGGKHVIVGQKNCQVQGSVLTFEPPAEFKKRFMHEKPIGMGKRKNLGQAWLEWPGKSYLPNGTGFYPDTKKCPKGVFNFFRGFQVKPVNGDCSPYLNHLKQVICAGDEVSYTYLIGWLAHLFQQPDVKPNVAIVLKSVEGTGKGTMAEPLLEILGFHGNKTNGAYAIASRFNGTLASRLFIFADEVDLTDKHVADRLKGLISETTVNLERKGLEIEPLPNYCRLIFASNHTRVLNAGIRERRYLVLEPSDHKAQDSAYFDKLWSWIKDNGAAKLLHYLLQVDISEFSPYKCPQTKALIAEKLDNLSGVNRFFYNEIMKPEPFGGRARVCAHDLINDFVHWSHEDDIKISMPAARSLIGRMMGKLKIEVKGRSDRGDGKYYDLPSREELVQLFAEFLDIPESALEL